MPDDTPPPNTDACAVAAAATGSLPKRAKSHFLEATKAMMEALDVAEGMTSHELECFKFNFDQFVTQMRDDASAREQATKLPMRRHDWGKKES